MRVFRIRGGEIPPLFYHSKIILHSQKVSIGEKILIDIGEVVMGPATIVSSTTQEAVIQMDPDFNYFYDTDEDEVWISDMKSILMPYEYYESVTGNIFLDGFLRAATSDEHGIIFVEITDSLTGLVDYFSKAMDEANITHHKIGNAFVIDDVQVIEQIFDEWCPRLPPKYVIGYLCSFLLRTKLYSHRNPKYSKYTFILGSGYESEVSTDDFFEMNSKGQHIMYSLFGIMDPLSSLIDSIDGLDVDLDLDMNSTVPDGCKVGPDIYQQLVKMMFKYGGYYPEYKINSDYVIVRSNKYDDNKKVKITFSDDDFESNYLIKYTSEDLLLYEMTEQGPVHPQSLFYNSVFDFGAEMSSYFHILFNRL